MKKTTLRSIGGFLGCMAAVALVSCGVYYGNSSVRSWIAGSSSSSAAATSEANADGTMKIALPHGPKFASAAGATLSLSATVSPDTATDKRVAWACSDTSKVTLSASTTQSGGSVTATLVAVYSSYVTVTATAVSNPSAALSVKLWCGNDFHAGDTSWKLYANGVEDPEVNQDVLLTTGSGATYVNAKVGSVSTTATAQLAQITPCDLGSSASVTAYHSYFGEDDTRIPTAFDALGLAAGAITDPPVTLDPSLYSFKGATSSGGTSTSVDLDKSGVEVKARSAVLGGVAQVQVFYTFKKVYAGYSATEIFIGDSVGVMCFNVSEYVAPSGLAGDTNKTF